MNKTKSRLDLPQPKRRRPRQADDALIYLKLRENNCEHKKALIFTSRKEHKVFYRTDATVIKDGPASCRALTPSIEKQCVHGGWMINSKLKYTNAMCPSREISMNQTKERRGIAKLISQERNRVESARKEYNEYLGEMDFVLGERQINLEKIKESIRRHREEKEAVIECQGVKMSETSSILVKEEALKKNNSLISRLGAFDVSSSKPSTPSQRKRSLSRLKTPRTWGQKRVSIESGSINPQQSLKNSSTPRLLLKSQLINFGNTEVQDNDFYFTLSQVMKNLPQLTTQSSLSIPASPFPWQKD